MRTYYLEMVRVAFDHAYYQGNTPRFTFHPQQLTRSVMRRAGLLFREVADGFSILYPAIKDQADALVPMRKMPDALALRFWICPLDAYVGSVSALPAFRTTRQTLYVDNLTDRKDGDTLYLNRGAPAVTTASSLDIVNIGTGTWRYSQAAADPIFVRVQHARGTVAAAEYCRPHEGVVSCQIDLGGIDPGLVGITAGSKATETYYLPESAPESAAFAAVDLYAGPSVPEAYQFLDAAGLPTPKTFTCRIGSQSSTWRYVVVPRFRTTLNAAQLSIDDAESRYTFGAPAAMQTMAGEAAFAIESEGVIPHQEKPIKGLSLKRNNADLIKELPNPGPDQVLVRETGRYSEIHVYV